jgi:hypothetical protein
VESMSDIEKFIDTKIYRITGFLHPVDAMAFAGLAAWQKSHGIAGSVMEIGVFYGRSFALMAKSIDTSREVAVAADLFDIGIVPSGESSQLTSFRSTLGLAGVETTAVRVIQGDSSLLDAGDILKMAGKIRFFSIDGGHEEHHVRTDAKLAQEVMSEDGMIVFDDFFNPRYPDVTYSVFLLLANEMSEFSPFLITKGKLYICRKERLRDYRNAVKQLHLWAGAKIEQCRFMGGEIAYLFQSTESRAVYQVMASIGLGGMAAGLLRFRGSRFSR